MNASTVTVSSYILRQHCEAALKKIEDEREQARRFKVMEKLVLMRNSWYRKWRKLPVPTFEGLYAQEEKAGLVSKDTAFYYCQFRHREHERQLRLMLTACELRNEVVLTLQDLKYLGPPVHTPIPTIFLQ
jgi:hypothetical protein